MNAASLLDWCRKHDVRLTLRGEKLHWNAPPGVVSDVVRTTLQKNKSELLKVLKHGPLAAGETGIIEEAPRRIRNLRPGWIKGEKLRALPEVIQGLVCEREGWSPASWAEYLKYKADRCRDFEPCLAERYEFAATLLGKGGQ